MINKTEIIDYIENNYLTNPLDRNSDLFKEDLKIKMNKIIDNKFKNDKSEAISLIKEIMQSRKSVDEIVIDYPLVINNFMDIIDKNIYKDIEFKIELINMFEKDLWSSELTDKFFEENENQENLIVSLLTKELSKKDVNIFLILKTLKNANELSIENIKSSIKNNNPQQVEIFKNLIKINNDYITEMLNEKLGENFIKEMSSKTKIAQPKLKKTRAVSIDFDDYDF